jgi:serine/threonine protein kinase
MFSGDEDMIKLIDFGLCQEYKVTKDLQEIVGTPFYMAPEVI